MVAKLKLASDKDDTVHKDLTQKSNSLTDPDVILFFAGRLALAEEKKKEAAAVVTGIDKQMNSAGIQKQAFAIVKKAAKEGPDAIFEMMRQVQHIANAMSVPIGKQMTLFENPAEKTGGMSIEGLLEQASKEGRMLGLMGKNPDEQKWQPSTPVGQAHLDGWNAGQEELQRRFLAMNQQMAEEEAEKKAKEAAAGKKRDERLAKAKAAGAPPKTDTGETEQ